MHISFQKSVRKIPNGMIGGLLLGLRIPPALAKACA